MIIFEQKMFKIFPSKKKFKGFFFFFEKMFFGWKDSKNENTRKTKTKKEEKRETHIKKWKNKRTLEK